MVAFVKRVKSNLCSSGYEINVVEMSVAPEKVFLKSKLIIISCGAQFTPQTGRLF